MKDRTMDNVQNCDNYSNRAVGEPGKSWEILETRVAIRSMSCTDIVITEFEN
jgi:hypothetical protein